VPVYELLGGKFRDSVWVYADCQVEPSMEFDEVKRVVEGVLERGFTALKIDVDLGVYTHDYRRGGGIPKDRFNYTADAWEHERMLALVEMVTTAAGQGAAVAVDVHTRLDIASAIRLAKDLEPFHLLWLEEPVPPENVAAMREVKQATSTPICTGENLYLRHGFRDLIVQQAADIIMPDIPKCGGLSECRKIANLAELYYIPFAPHNVSSPIGTMASAHVCASVPNFLVLEFHWLHRDYWTTIITDNEDIIKDGKIKLSDRPGIGVELNEEVARQHQYAGTTWFE
jgi:L-alanine-DL-glutamate epimerase-like enolase superfamily enzyme